VGSRKGAASVAESGRVKAGILPSKEDYERFPYSPGVRSLTNPLYDVSRFIEVFFRCHGCRPFLLSYTDGAP
jgi:hypothetical protein